MRQHEIVVDIDGVVADLVASYLPRLALEIGRSIAISDITQFNFDKALSLEDGASWALMERLFRNGLLRRLNPVAGALQGMTQLSDHHLVRLVTTRPAAFNSDTEAWLHAVGLSHLPFRCLGCSDKTDCGNADILIDDRWRTARTCASLLPHVILLSWPWNERPDPLPSNVHRASDWSHICQIVDRLANGCAG